MQRAGTYGLTMVGLLALVTAALVGCGGSGSPPVAAAGGPSTTNASEPGADATADTTAPESSAGGVAGTATSSAAAGPPRTRLEQCQDVGQAMQRALPPEEMASTTDAAKLRSVAKELLEGAGAVERTATDVDEVRQVRDAYVAAARGMAKALEDAAGAKDPKAQKEAVARFRADEPKLGELLTKLTDVCNAKKK